MAATGVRSPVKREVLQPAFHPSPAIREERENSYEEKANRYEESGARDSNNMGASPSLPPPRHRYHHREPSDEDTPIFPERYHGPKGNTEDYDACSVATEDDCILDIEKLRQMPKLL
jgi:hypothetical protein